MEVAWHAQFAINARRRSHGNAQELRGVEGGEQRAGNGDLLRTASKRSETVAAVPGFACVCCVAQGLTALTAALGEPRSSKPVNPVLDTTIRRLEVCYICRCLMRSDAEGFDGGRSEGFVMCSLARVRQAAQTGGGSTAKKSALETLTLAASCVLRNARGEGGGSAGGVDTRHQDDVPEVNLSDQ